MTNGIQPSFTALTLAGLITLSACSGQNLPRPAREVSELEGVFDGYGPSAAPMRTFLGINFKTHHYHCLHLDGKGFGRIQFVGSAKIYDVTVMKQGDQFLLVHDNISRSFRTKIKEKGPRSILFESGNLASIGRYKTLENCIAELTSEPIKMAPLEARIPDPREMP